MARQPKLVLRESCVGDLSAGWLPGSFVEMGAGTGYMARVFLERGFHGACHDLGDDSRQLIRANLAPYGGRISVVETLDEIPAAGFDYLFAFEVLEHVEDDREVFAAWSAKLRPGGRVLLSVPAHQRKFGKADEIVGHVRRYERDELESLLLGAGYTDISIVNYGFPLTEATRRFSNFLVRGDKSYDTLSPQEKSIRSAQTRPAIVTRWIELFGERAVLPFCEVQRWFYDRDWGDGLVASAIKPR
jgi:SAM-dependent methyltransferase